MKVTEIHVYRERNYRSDPKDKFAMGKVGIGVTVSVAEGDQPAEVLDKANQTAVLHMEKVIMAEQVQAGF